MISPPKSPESVKARPSRSLGTIQHSTFHIRPSILMKKPIHPRAVFTAICLAVLSVFAPSAEAAPPDLTAAGVIAALRADPNYSSPPYSETYNLGATGLRGWIYIGGGNGADGTITTESRQILVTVASTPGSAVLAVDDVILGAMAGSSGIVPAFASDCPQGLRCGHRQCRENRGRHPARQTLARRNHHRCEHFHDRHGRLHRHRSLHLPEILVDPRQRPQQAGRPASRRL